MMMNAHRKLTTVTQMPHVVIHQAHLHVLVVPVIQEMESLVPVSQFTLPNRFISTALQLKLINLVRMGFIFYITSFNKIASLILAYEPRGLEHK